MAILASIQQSSPENRDARAQPARPTQSSAVAWPEWPSQASAPTAPAAPPLPAPTTPPALPEPAEPPEWMPWPRFSAALQRGEPLRAPSARCAHSVASGRRKALLIALNYPGTPAERRCGRNDLERVTQILLRLGFQEEWILKLSDCEPGTDRRETKGRDVTSKSNFVAALQWLTHNVVSGDVLFFHYSGHSALHEEGNALLDAYCPSDFAEAGHLPSRDCYELVSTLPKGVRLTMLVDCCVPCSCPQLPFQWNAQSLQWSEDADASSLAPTAAADIVGLGGASEAEMSPEQLTEALRAEQGPITEAFLQAMQELAARRKGPVTFAELLEGASLRLQGTAHAFLQLSATRLFDPKSRSFRFFDAIETCWTRRRMTEARLMEFHSPMELTMIINAASKLRISDEELYHRFVAHDMTCMGTEAFHVRDISVIVTALARVNCVDAKTMSRFCDGVVPTLPEATPLELARLMYACMSVSCHAHDLFTACVLHNREKASSMDPTALSNAAYAFGQCFEVAEVSHLRYLQKIFRHLRLASVASLPLFLPREIVGLLKTYARWQITFDCGQLCKVADRMLACKKHFDMETTVNGLHCLALLMQRNAVRGESGSSQAAWEAHVGHGRGFVVKVVMVVMQRKCVVEKTGLLPWMLGAVMLDLIRS
ncbi:unnamed protein product [Durusdinium trenchii]|uniref:Peptidase C14 caspase domain-containing protein n=1 Tax=Durusdinium trenchii TaxID=1381693 RepID=A0ABP0KLM4_9DINO